MRKPLVIIVIVLAVLAVLATIVVPNFLEAMRRSNQRRTLADLRTIATAWEARATDLKTYAIGAKAPDPVDDTTVSWNELKHVSPAELQRALVPKYIRALPMNDSWGKPFEFAAGDQTYAIRSLGHDGKPDASTRYKLARTTSFDADIVYSNGSFIRGPEGM